MDVRERAKPAEDERILSMTDGSHSEGRNPEALEADKARYKDSTYEIVSKVAYLIGVPKRIFENEYEPPKMEVYERLEQDKAARIIRHLCMIRTAIERNFKHINEKMRFDYTSIYNLPEYIPQDSMAQLTSDGINFVKKSSKKLCHHVIEINKLIADRITDSNLNHTGIYLYSKGKIMIHLTFDYKTDEKCTTPGQYLKYHRTFQGLTTRELAEKVGIVPATLVLYENDRHPIKHDIAVALANTLGIDRNRLLDEYTAFVDYPYSSLLKKVRHELSLTQMQMAEVIGIGQTTYSGWEREARVPRRKEHDKILAALKKLKVNVDTYLCQSTSI